MKRIYENARGRWRCWRRKAVRYTSPQDRDLNGVYDQVINDLGKVYSLGYKRRTKTRRLWRAVVVQILKRPDVSARFSRVITLIDGTDFSLWLQIETVFLFSKSQTEVCATEENLMMSGQPLESEYARTIAAMSLKLAKMKFFRSCVPSWTLSMSCWQGRSGTRNASLCRGQGGAYAKSSAI